MELPVVRVCGRFAEAVGFGYLVARRHRREERDAGADDIGGPKRADLKRVLTV